VGGRRSILDEFSVLSSVPLPPTQTFWTFVHPDLSAALPLVLASRNPNSEDPGSNRGVAMAFHAAPRVSSKIGSLRARGDFRNSHVSHAARPPPRAWRETLGCASLRAPFPEPQPQPPFAPSRLLARSLVCSLARSRQIRRFLVASTFDNARAYGELAVSTCLVSWLVMVDSARGKSPFRTSEGRGGRRVGGAEGVPVIETRVILAIYRCFDVFR